MSEEFVLFTCGTWTVKPGKAQEFINAWQAFADWTSQGHFGAGTGTLLQGEDDPDQFLSFGPWEDIQAIADWRSKREFQDFFTKAQALCTKIHPQNMHIVAYSHP